MYEKCIDLFGNQMNLLLKSELKFSFKRGGAKKLEVKIAKSVRLLIIAVINLTVLYDRDQKAASAIELVDFGFSFGKRRPV